MEKPIPSCRTSPVVTVIPVSTLMWIVHMPMTLLAIKAELARPLQWCMKQFLVFLANALTVTPRAEREAPAPLTILMSGLSTPPCLGPLQLRVSPLCRLETELRDGEYD